MEDGDLIEDEQHAKLFARGAKIFLLGNILVVLGSTTTGQVWLLADGFLYVVCNRISFGKVLRYQTDCQEFRDVQLSKLTFK